MSHNSLNHATGFAAINVHSQETSAAKLTIGSVSDDKLLSVIDRVQAVYEREKVAEAFVECHLDHEALKEEMETPGFGPGVIKHLKQNSSLLGHLDRASLLDKPGIFVEFGSGRGQLTYWLTRAVKDKLESRFILVDKASHRHKFDNRLKNEEEVLQVDRIRTDIQDLALEKVPGIVDSDKVP